MEVNETKKLFLKEELPRLLMQLDGQAHSHWGLMNGQQMVEHLVDAVMIASGKWKLPMVNQGERLEKLRAFMQTEDPFKENTKNPLLGDLPSPLRKANMKEAIRKLKEELDYFFKVFQENPSLITSNPIFGELDWAMNIQLLHKHAIHHLRQFGLP